MTKQEEIREGLRASILENTQFNSHRGVVLKVTGLSNILSYLHSQGVVVKVERELPTQKWDEFMEHDWVDLTPTEIAIMKGMIRAGYEATEPLIERGNGSQE